MFIRSRGINVNVYSLFGNIPEHIFPKREYPVHFGEYNVSQGEYNFASLYYILLEGIYFTPTPITSQIVHNIERFHKGNSLSMP
jgi:hypothetical protein